MRLLEQVTLSVDELEALRLKDLRGLEQEEAAREMGVSRQTFQRIQDDAHRKVAEALVTGKALEIDGGDYEVVPMHFHCRRCGHGWEQLLTGGVPVACPNCEENAADLPFASGVPERHGTADLESQPVTEGSTPDHNHRRRNRAGAQNYFKGTVKE